jgi:hypothetical protein
MRRLIYLLLVFVSLFLITTKDVFAELDYMPKPPQPGSEYNPADYLILQSIGVYNNSGKGRCLKDSGSSIAATGHFDEDHYDLTCHAVYIDKAQDMVVSVDVTKHAGADSDRLLLHEMDAEFRTYYGIPGLSFTNKNIDGNNVYVFEAGGRDYRWVSGNKLIRIDYTALQMSTKPEPIEVVRAYLVKHPSTIPSMSLLELRGNANVTKWIKDEVDRRLWLCDKWNAQFQAGQTTQKDLLFNLNRSIGVFLNYRQKYYGVSATDDLNAMSVFMQNNDLTSIQNKLIEYKTWWTKHKEKRISLPGNK